MTFPMQLFFFACPNCGLGELGGNVKAYLMIARCPGPSCSCTAGRWTFTKVGLILGLIPGNLPHVNSSMLKPCQIISTAWEAASIPSNTAEQGGTQDDSRTSRTPTEQERGGRAKAGRQQTTQGRTRQTNSPEQEGRGTRREGREGGNPRGRME